MYMGGSQQISPKTRREERAETSMNEITSLDRRFSVNYHNRKNDHTCACEIKERERERVIRI